MTKRLLPLLVALVLCLGCISGCAAEEAAQVWSPKEAPAIRNRLSEEEVVAERNAILAKGTLIYSGKTNQGFNSGSNMTWLKEAAPEDAVALLWACDDVSHGGWGVLGLSINGVQQEIVAVSDHPEKERLNLYTIAQLMETVGIQTPADFKGMVLGAWNGGRVAGLYLLKSEAAAEMAAHVAKVEASEAVIHTYTGQLSNENAIPAAKTLYEYLKSVWKTGCLTGQMESTWMGSPDYEMLYLQKHTGKLPAIRGLDFMHNDFRGVAGRAQQWWEQGGIPHICWHTGSDFASGYNESKDHNLNWETALTPGTADYDKLIKAMDRAVPYLQQLEDAGVPVLWRPFHELDGGWFWWSKGGSESFVKLWQLMYSRYTDYWGLDNLIWLLGYSGNGGNMAAWYPGDDYVDLIGADSYTPGANGQLYAEVAALAPEGMPIVFHECGTIPTKEQMQAEQAPWLMFMVWHTDFLTDGQSNTVDSLKAIYESEYFITLDELPFHK
jgi:hypothetical protein